MMLDKNKFKVLVVAIEVFALLAVVAGFFLMVPDVQVSAAPVTIFDLAGNVKYYDPASGGFVLVQAGQPLPKDQSLVTGADSWVRLALFGDGSAMQIGAYSSLVYLESGEQDGKPFARLRLNIGEVYVVPQNGAIYIETPAGRAYVDAPLAALHVSYDPQTGQAKVSCLGGVCRATADGQDLLLAAGQAAGLVPGEQAALFAITEPEVLKAAHAQELVKPVPLAAALEQLQPTAVKLMAQEKQPDPTAMPTMLPAKPTAVPPTEPPVSPPATKAPTQSPSVSLPPTQAPTVAPTEEAEDEMRSASFVPNQEYFTNPGMGWQYRGGDYPTNKVVNETIGYAPRAEISWQVLNPAEGVYDWSELDANLNYVVSQGKQFSFRVYTMRGEVYGGHQLPQWVLDKGARVFSDGQVDYANCTYQQEWGKFVNKLIQRYDGNPNIAFIDISGYGNFNEWSWQDQTEWDQTWADAYAKGNASRSTMSNMDSYARRVLADMFIGGSYSGHQCRTANNQVRTVNYSYNGFKQTQLLMPYAGIIQASQYVHSMSSVVGFRHDCLGRTSSNSIVNDDRLGKELDRIWPKAPVLFETCKPNEFTMANAEYLLEEAHASIVHDVNIDLGTDDILRLVSPIGYQYKLTEFRYNFRLEAGGEYQVYMTWQNVGYAPSYPRMGQRFQLHVYYYNMDGEMVADIPVDSDISKWMPAASPGGIPPTYVVEVIAPVGADVPYGLYTAEVKIIDIRTGKPIWVPVNPDMRAYK